MSKISGSWSGVRKFLDFIKQGIKERQDGLDGQIGYWADYWTLLDKTPMDARSEYTDEEFCEALALYRNQDIKLSISSQNPIVLMFALLDKRAGKRTLKGMEGEFLALPEWLRELYDIRVSA